MLTSKAKTSKNEKLNEWFISSILFFTLFILITNIYALLLLIIIVNIMETRIRIPTEMLNN